jgi:pimeloyl-ACP methyl ester carboxylesterase
MFLLRGYHYTPAKIETQILAVFAAMSLKRVHWVGESSGGIIGLLLAAAHPERIASLVLCNTPTRISDEIKGIYALDRESTRLPDVSYDRALSKLVLPSVVPQPGLMVAEMRRVTRPGGVVAAAFLRFARGGNPSQRM